MTEPGTASPEQPARPAAELPAQAGPADPAVPTPASPASGRPADAPPPKGIDLARAALLQARAQARNTYEKQQERRDGKRGLRRSGARPDDRDPQPLRRVMGRMIAERGWQTPAAVHGVIGRWAEIVGPGIAPHCQPEKFEDGRLVVRADSDNFATHVRWLAPKLLARINQELGDGTVTWIEVRGPAGASRRGQWRAGS